jgi:antirestriction protein ArdC
MTIGAEFARNGKPNSGCCRLLPRCGCAQSQLAAATTSDGGAPGFLCGFAGLSNPLSAELSAAYIRGWSEVFRRDPRILLRAASAAQRAADYIRGKVVAEPEAVAA